MQYQDNNSW